jgi:hypothetical protein
METIMDLKNNAIGRSLFLSFSNNTFYSGKFEQLLKLSLIKIINSVQLWHLTPLDAISQIIPNVTELVPTNK